MAMVTQAPSELPKRLDRLPYATKSSLPLYLPQQRLIIHKRLCPPQKLSTNMGAYKAQLCFRPVFLITLWCVILTDCLFVQSYDILTIISFFEIQLCFGR